MAGQGTTADAEVVIIGGERSDTRNGKERYVVRTNDGREMSVWDRNVYDAVMAHLHEPIKATLFTKQDAQQRWWTSLQGLPEMGIKSAPPSGGGGGGSGGQAAAAPDLSVMYGYLDRIATALENLVSFQVEQAMRDVHVPEEPFADQDVPTTWGPDEEVEPEGG